MGGRDGARLPIDNRGGANDLSQDRRAIDDRTALGVAFTDVDGSTKVASPATPLPVTGRQESVALVTANTAIAPVTLYGDLHPHPGLHGLWQRRAALSVAGWHNAYPGDEGRRRHRGGTVFQFGTSQVVDVLLTGTTGCTVTLSRIP